MNLILDRSFTKLKFSSRKSYGCIRYVMLIILIHILFVVTILYRRESTILFENFQKILQKIVFLNSSIFFTVEVVGIKIIKGRYLCFITNHVLLTV